MIVREKPDSFVLVEQHEHALISGEFAEHWRDRPRPLGPTLFAVANHDVGWKKLDGRVLWDEEAGRPYSFMDYPTAMKLQAYGDGLDLVESRDPYAACLCSMHYVTIVRGSEGKGGVRFVEAELARQRRLKGGMSDEELENLERNLSFLKLFDGLSLFVCLNEPGEDAYPLPYRDGFELLGQRYEPVWEDRSVLRLDPNPFLGPFGIAVPYSVVDKGGRPAGSGRRELRVTC